MKKTKAPKLTGCQNCPWNGLQKIEPDDREDNPDLLIIAEAPGNTEKEKGIPLVGESGQIVRALLRNFGIKAVLFNSAQCYSKKKPDSKVIKACREEYVLPLLSTYPGVPVLAMGEYAAKSLLGGTEKGKLGLVLRLYGHDCYFTYHPAFYLRSGKDKVVLENIKVMMQSAVAKDNILDSYSMQDGIGIFEGNLLDSKSITIDIETTGKEYPWYGDEILLTGLMGDDRLVYNTTDPKELLFLNDYTGEIVIHNGAVFDLVYLYYYGITFPYASLFDTKIGLKFNNYTIEKDTTLKWQVKKMFGGPGYEAEVNSYMREHNKSLKGIDPEVLRVYNAKDVVYTRMLRERINPKQAIPFGLSMDYARYIIKLIANGMYLNQSEIQKISSIKEKQMEEKMSEIITETYVGFNPNSPKQIKEVFNAKYGISLEDTTAETLAKYSKQYPIAKKISEYGSLSHFKSTFCDGYLSRCDTNSLAHSKFKVEQAITGRMSSSSPNLQNDDPEIRGVFESRYKE